MLAAKQAKTNKELLEVIQGAQINSGSVGTNGAGSPNFQDLTALAFADVLPGDNVYISGVLLPYVVLSKTDDNNIIMTTNIALAHVANAKWKALRGGIGEANIKFGGPISDVLGQGQWTVFYVTDTFGV
jgi:hypothetical protein